MKIKYIIAIILALGAVTSSYGQQVVIKDGYAVISAEGYSQGKKSDVSTVFKDVSFGSLDASLKVKRVERHNVGDVTNKQISPLFAIASTDIDVEGKSVTTKTTMTWAKAGGWSENANTTTIETPQFAVATGCPEYKGKDGTDTPGTWRLPTYRELHLINLLKIAVDKTKDATGWIPCFDYYYWSSTEQSVVAAYTLSINGHANNSTPEKNKEAAGVRCVKDLSVP